MALVKKARITGKGGISPQTQTSPAPAATAPDRGARRRTPVHQQQTLTERLAAATEELASGLAEASAAAEELRRAMEQIASGAEEAAGASQEQVGAIKSVVANLSAARGQAEDSRRRAESLQIVLTEAALQITASSRAIERNAERQEASVAVISELERRAQDIREITRTVSRISDQTNLLALNAAIEAARAGDHGRGFAVVADEVRALAETSERNAQEVQELAVSIETDVRGAVAAVRSAAEAAVGEARAAARIVQTFDAMRGDMNAIAGESQATLTATLEAERAATEAHRGAEQVAVAAEEQSAAANEAQLAVQQQAQSLDQAQVAAQAIAALTENLRTRRADASAAEEVGAAAEELSATVQELSSSANEIMAAVEQINRGSQQQASATQQTSAALAQIEDSARLAEKNANVAGGRVKAIAAAAGESRASIERLVAGIGTALDVTRGSIATIARLETLGRRIDRVVDAIALIAVQTTMLAVSGSVEAARAGSSGRGFALVSNDIRVLAREATESIERAKETVRGILDQATSVRRDLDQIVVAVDIELQNNQTMFQVLERVDADVSALSLSNQEITQSAGAILSATVEIATGARQIAAAAEQAGAASREAATASTQQARGAEDLAAAIEEIASLADELKSQNA